MPIDDGQVFHPVGNPRDECVGDFLLRQESPFGAQNPRDLLTILGMEKVDVDRFNKRCDVKDDIVFNHRRVMGLRRRIADDLQQLADPQPRVGKQRLVVIEFFTQRQQCC